MVVKNAALAEMGCRHAATHRGNPTRGDSTSCWNEGHWEGKLIGMRREGKAHRHTQGFH